MTTTTEKTHEKTISDRRVHLKVKIKSLAAEAKIIRREERLVLEKIRRGWTDRVWAFDTLQSHRKGVVRTEARASHLAYAFIRGKAYRTVEATVRAGNEPDWEKVTDLVWRFGGALPLLPRKLGKPAVLKAVQKWAKAKP